MKPFNVRKKQRPEAKIQAAITLFLERKGWFVKSTHGNMFQSGFPDLYATHSEYGPRWIEVKLPGMKGSRFTRAQLEDFPKFVNAGAGVWIMTGATEFEYGVLFRPNNYWQYLNIFK